MNYSITRRVAELQSKIDASHRFWSNNAKEIKEASPPSARSAHEAGVLAGAKYREETASWVSEIEALTAPIVSFSEHDGKLFLATSKGAFELRDGVFVMVPIVAKPPDATN